MSHFFLQDLSEVVYVKHKTRVMFCCPICPQGKSIILKSREDTIMEFVYFTDYVT